MTEKIEINRQALYLTIDNFKVETKDGIEIKANQFVVYFKYEPPTEIILGEQIKNDEGGNAVFDSADDAKSFAVEKLKRTIYPPNFLHPLKYTTENLGELMHKELIYDIGNPNSTEITETFEGVMTGYSLAANPPYMPATATILSIDGSEKDLTFFDIKRIRRK